MEIKVPYTYLLLLLANFRFVGALENGVARTPPMGWLSWTRFMCQVNCKKYPKDCISEKLFIEMAKELVEQGYRDVGYVHINLDDCWMSKKRDENNRLVADPVRFSHGIPWLVDYMHDRGLKLGIYENYGKTTCMGFPGSQDFMQIDANTFIEWNVDMLKFDGCFTDLNLLDDAYPEMGKYLNESNKKLIYGCSWPYYLLAAGRHPNYEKIIPNCNLWRNFEDIQINWQSLIRIINFYDENQEELSKYHGPGHWNDPDMLIIGNPGLTADQCRTQMAIWSIWSAPLLMSNDLRNIKPEFREILINRKVIAIDQDPLGNMGKKILEIGSVNVYKKPVLPLSFDKKEFSYAIVFFNRDESQIKIVRISFEQLKMTFERGYEVENLFTNEELGLKTTSDSMEVHVAPMGVVMWKATVNDLPLMDEEKKAVEKKVKALGKGLVFGQTHDYSERSSKLLICLVVIVAVLCYFCRRSLFRIFRRKCPMF